MAQSKKPRQFRQGDVFLEEVDPSSVPSAGRQVIPKDSNRTILAYGEATGHAHAIVDKEDVEETEFFEFPNGDRFLVTKGGISLLSHEEHGVIELPPAMYRVTIQEEYKEDGSWHRVMD